MPIIIQNRPIEPSPLGRNKLNSYSQLRSLMLRSGIRVGFRTMQSENYVAASAGWIFRADGTIEATTLVSGSFIKTFAQDAIPTSVNVGDIWTDTNDSNKLYRAESIGADQITAGEWVAIPPGVEWADILNGASQKPDNNADVTASNTAADSALLNAVAAAQVQARAEVFWLKPSFLGSKNDGLTESVGGTGTVARRGIDSILTAGNSSAQLSSSAMGDKDYSDSFEMICNAKLGSGSADFDAYWGTGDFGVSGTPVSNTSIVRHIGWMTDAGTLVASVADGSTQTKSSTITQTLTNKAQYYIDWATGSSAKFYISGVLKATLSTNLPSGGNAELQFGVQNRTADGALTLSNGYFIKFD